MVKWRVRTWIYFAGFFIFVNVPPATATSCTRTGTTVIYIGAVLAWMFLALALRDILGQVFRSDWGVTVVCGLIAAVPAVTLVYANCTMQNVGCSYWPP
jgi:multidrug efflux pump subunit AcrB